MTKTGSTPHRWTPAEDDQVRAAAKQNHEPYGWRPGLVEALAQTLGRSLAAVRHRATRIGARAQQAGAPRWTTAEDDQLRAAAAQNLRAYGRKPGMLEALAPTIGRTPAAVRIRASRIGARSQKARAQNQPRGISPRWAALAARAGGSPPADAHLTDAARQYLSELHRWL